MSLGIANNVGALNAQNNLNRSQNNLNTSIERLSTGFRVNRGSDGPAALVISEQQRAQISGLRTAIDNTERAVSVVQTAEGALGEINNLLVQVRSLAIDSANTGVNDEDALAANQAEIANALETIDRISNNTQFGQRNLIDGSATRNVTADDADVTIVGGTDDLEAGSFAIEVTAAATQAEVTGANDLSGGISTDETLTINGEDINLTDGQTATEVVDTINAATDDTGVVASLNGSNQLVLTSNDFGEDATITIQSDNGTSGFGITEIVANGTDVEATIGGNAAVADGLTITGTDGDTLGVQIELSEAAANGAPGAQGNVVVDDNRLVFQIGANQGQTVNISIDSVASTSLGAGVEDNGFANLSEIDVTTAEGSQDALGIIDAAISEVSNLRGTLGAFQGTTLESTANNLRTTLENTVNAESVIRDTDFAEEISNFTNSQVQVQAGTSVLSSACLLYTSPSPRDGLLSRMPSSA